MPTNLPSMDMCSCSGAGPTTRSRSPPRLTLECTGRERGPFPSGTFKTGPAVAVSANGNVETGGDETVLTDQFASRRCPIALGVQHAIDVHGPVHGEINAVEREQSFQTLQEFRFQFTVSSALNGISRDRLGKQGR